MKAGFGGALMVATVALTACSSTPNHTATSPSTTTQTGLPLTVTPTSGPIGTRVRIQITGCRAAKGYYALSFNDADVSAMHAGSAAHVHAIGSPLARGSFSTTYVIPATSGPAGTFYMQCGDSIASSKFVLTGSGPIHELTAFVDRLTPMNGGYRLVVRPATFIPEQDSYQLTPHRSKVTFDVAASVVPDPRLITGAIEITTRGSEVISIAVIGG